MIILLGMPGAGKTTQTQMLADSLNCPWFSMGELIRAKTTGKDRAEMLEGKIIDDKITLEILGEAMKDLDLAKQECIVEGNPRSIPQADWWLAKIRSGEVKLKGIVEMSITEPAALQRLAKRGRMDDHDTSVVHKRFAEYERSVTPTLDYLKKQGIAVHKVDASRSIEDVAAQIKKSLKLI